MKAVRFRFVSIKNFRWIGIYVFRMFTIPLIYDFFPKPFYRRTLVKYMANSFTKSIALFAFWRRFHIHFPKVLVGFGGENAKQGQKVDNKIKTKMIFG